MEIFDCLSNLKKSGLMHVHSYSQTSLDKPHAFYDQISLTLLIFEIYFMANLFNPISGHNFDIFYGYWVQKKVQDR